MNAAFLLVTTAWFAGDTTAAGGCCGATYAATCDSCGSGGHKLLNRLRGGFRHGGGGGCDTCAPTCAPCAPAPPAPQCVTCAPAPCASCGHGHGGPKLLDRLRAGFHHNKGSCDGGCSSCGTCDTCGAGPIATPVVTPKAGEPIPVPPKKMPSQTPPPPPAKTGFNSAPPATIQASPAIETVFPNNAAQTPPAVVPNIEPENLRNPF